MWPRFIGALLSLMLFTAVTGECVASLAAGGGVRESQLVIPAGAESLLSIPERGRSTAGLTAGEWAFRRPVRIVRIGKLRQRYVAEASRPGLAPDPPAFHRELLVPAATRSDSPLAD